MYRKLYIFTITLATSFRIKDETVFIEYRDMEFKHEYLGHVVPLDISLFTVNNCWLQVNIEPMVISSPEAANLRMPKLLLTPEKRIKRMLKFLKQTRKANFYLSSSFCSISFIRPYRIVILMLLLITFLNIIVRCYNNTYLFIKSYNLKIC